MLGMGISKAKAGFFDRQAVLGAMGKAERGVLSKFGAFVRQRAKTSMWKRKEASKPGQPPSRHLGLLGKFLFFVFESARHSVVIGPADLNERIGNAPEALEKGGLSETMRRGAKVRVRVRPRPFMKPAFDRELPGVGKLWQDALNKNKG